MYRLTLHISTKLDTGLSINIISLTARTSEHSRLQALRPAGPFLCFTDLRWRADMKSTSTSGPSAGHSSQCLRLDS